MSALINSLLSSDSTSESLIQSSPKPFGIKRGLWPTFNLSSPKNLKNFYWIIFYIWLWLISKDHAGCVAFIFPFIFISSLTYKILYHTLHIRSNLEELSWWGLKTALMNRHNNKLLGVSLTLYPFNKEEASLVTSSWCQGSFYLQ